MSSMPTTYVSGCDCDDCKAVRERRDGVKLAKVKRPHVEPVAAKPERTPRGLSAIRKLAKDYFENPAKFLDMDTLRRNNDYRGDNTFTVEGQTFEQVTGLEKLGEGHYSIVYALDENRVLKVVKQGDSGYARFVGLVRNLNNPHFPKIFYSGNWGGKQIYILERLESGSRKVKNMFMEAVNMGDEASNSFLTVSKSVREASQVLRDNNLSSDLHSDNVMFRGDVPVITDPCSEGY